VLSASDFLTVEVWTTKGLVTCYLLILISLRDRVVKLVGITSRPDEAWMLRIARNLTDDEEGALYAKRFLIVDRDTKYSEQLRRLITQQSLTSETVGAWKNERTRVGRCVNFAPLGQEKGKCSRHWRHFLEFRIQRNPCAQDFVKFRTSYARRDVESALQRPDAFWMHPVPRRYDDPVRTQIRE
jgi:hypothetical protein